MAIKSNYSIAIRTLGTSGDSYVRLLDSIRESNLQPEKVVVVLPRGYMIPKNQLGYEEFVFSKKGMVFQRVEALKHISSKYTLFLDDDIEFNAEFVEKLMDSLVNGGFDCATGPLFEFFPQSMLGKIVGTLTASASVSVFGRNKYVNLLRSGGWSYRKISTNEHKFWSTDSFAGTCYLVDTDLAKKTEMDYETDWLEKYGYSYGEDQVFAYKLKAVGGRACIVSDALYIHNDAKTSLQTEDKIYKLNFMKYYFHRVFWQKFLHDDKDFIDRQLNTLCYTYYKITISIYVKLKSIKQPVLWKAFKDGMRK